MKNLKICFVAPSGYGKSTASKLLIKEFGGCVIKIAEPLYDLQDRFYSRLGIFVGDKQDGELLQFFGRKVREIKPNFLLEEFYKNVIGVSCYSRIIINDDCRPMDYEYLKNLGFIFVKINGFVRDRDDFTKSNPNNSLEWKSDIPCDYEINNYGDMEEYRCEILKLMEMINSDKQVLHYTCTKSL